MLRVRVTWAASVNRFFAAILVFLSELKMAGARIRTLLAPLVLLFSFIACAAPGGAGDSEPIRLRVMTFNIHHGADAEDQMRVEEMAEVIRAAEVDLVLLQEVDRGVERSDRRDVLAELSELSGLPHTAFGKNIDHQGGDYGNGLLSRYPVVRWENTHLRQEKPDRERRGVVQAVVQVDGAEVAVLATHLDAGDADERRISADEIVEELLPRYEGLPIILGGDLNEGPEGYVHRRLSGVLRDAWEAGEGEGNTIPVREPRRRIDFLFHSGDLVTDTAYVVQTDASDHLPVVADIRSRRGD